MSLVKKPKLTPGKLAANRANARLSRGPGTPEGRERMRAANTRHGFYARASGDALRVLGEDPVDFGHLVQSLTDTWQPANGFEEHLVMRLARALWRMERSDRVQESMAVRQIERQGQSMQLRDTYARQRTAAVIEDLKSLAAALAKEDYSPDSTEIKRFRELYGAAPEGEPKRILALLRRLRESAGEPIEGDSRTVALEGAREEARKELRELLRVEILAWEGALSARFEGSDEGPSSHERDEMLAPVYQDSVLMVRMEDSSFRQVWRLTNLLISLKDRALQAEILENEGTSDDVDANKGK